MADMSVLWSLLVNDLNDNVPGGLQHFELDYTARTATEPVGCNVQQFAAGALLRSIAKKFQGEIDQDAADSAAFAVFHEANTACEQWRLREEELGPYDEVLLGEFRKTLWEFFNPEGYPLLDLYRIEPHVGFGPGASVKANGTSYLTKIGHSVLTAPNKLTVDLFDQWVWSHPASIDCEITRCLAFGAPEVITATAITPVLKTAKISRLVKSETSLGMFFQKGIQRIFEDRLLTFFGISLTIQPQINAELARIGSILGTFATIDLKSASDYIAMLLCRAYIPRSSMIWMEAFRSTHALVEGEVVPLHMIATMGNAFCFPLQTAIFASAVVAAYKTLGIPLQRGRKELKWRRDPSTGEVEEIIPSYSVPNWGVFGDDIVVTEEAFTTVVRLLKALGFKPNELKSFSARNGNFRESCGSDWIDGFNVRGVYVKHLSTFQDWFTLINNLVDWSARTGIPLPGAVQWARSRCPDTQVPVWENPDAGIRVPSTCITSRKVFGCFESRRFGNLYGSYLYQKWEPHVAKTDVTDEVSAVIGGYWNSSAIYMAALKGELREGWCTERNYSDERTAYRKRTRVAPCWDYMIPGDVRKKHEQNWYRIAKGLFLKERISP